MLKPTRVAFFTDAYEEPNGVASLSREFAAYARRRELPFLSIHGAGATKVTQDGSLRTLELKRSIASFKLDQDLYCDPLFPRHIPRVEAEVRDFAPDVIHITGPGDMGILGSRIAHLNRIPLVASWHTNLHEYASRRVAKGFAFLPSHMRSSMSNKAEELSLKALLWFYKKPRMTMAPNLELVEMIGCCTKRPCTPMAHGVDLERFRPGRRSADQRPFTIGYVGRLTPEKNVRLLVEIESALERECDGDYRFVLVGEGSESGWLKSKMRHADLRGVLRGEALAEAFANMDVFVFPSETDTFGLVILEAMASGVPVVVARGGGPQFQVNEGENGFVVGDVTGFAAALLRLKSDRALQSRMGASARQHACENSWNGVFDQVYESYDQFLF